MDWKCLICGGEVPYEPEYCCSGKDCGCLGMPIHPPLCSEKCDKEFWEMSERKLK